MKDALTNRLDRIKKWLDDHGRADFDVYVGFEHNSTWITSPFYDETFRFTVNPIQYYGEDNIGRFVELAEERIQGESYELD